MTNQDTPKIVKFALTGGPCGGKTSALAYLTEELSEMDYLVLVVPEAATLCINGGVRPSDWMPVLAFQEALMDTGFKLEDIFHQAAFEVNPEKYKGIVILCDRGIIDGSAYMPMNDFRELLRRRGETLVDVRDARYDAVMHMTSTAIGAPDKYTLENNHARTETVEEAALLDRKTLSVWTGHPHIREIANDTDFETKLKRLLQEVCIVLGEPVPLENERKFLVRVDWNKFTSEAKAIDIEQTYLLTADNSHELRVRKRGQDGEFVYFLTEKRDHGPGKRLEIERIISKRDYDFCMRMRDPQKATVKKTRYCCFYQQQYLEVDVYDDYHLGESYNAILEIELTEDGQVVEFPEWVSYYQEVTDTPAYKNSAIAGSMAAGSLTGSV